MEKRDLNISFSKSGAGNLTPRISLPKKWIDKMGLSQEERAVEVFFDESTNEIIIKKK
ncbi:AbrB/MazE/SpoVT family DNA-binding domain-containing protein [Fusobacterium ulcerans]|uniref:AbrB/MazE/SpoVT family DNA-binding domain-containing protein n=1 Tax=Fusobacterium ulcerans TaxID=861 RepID=UPI003FEFEE3B